MWRKREGAREERADLCCLFSSVQAEPQVGPRRSAGLFWQRLTDVTAPHSWKRQRRVCVVG